MPPLALERETQPDRLRVLLLDMSARLRVILVAHVRPGDPDLLVQVVLDLVAQCEGSPGGSASRIFTDPMVSRGTPFDVVQNLVVNESQTRGAAWRFQRTTDPPDCWTSGWLAESDSKSLHQLSDREIQRCGDSLDIPKCNVSLPALNPADVSTVEIAFRSECLLRQSGTLSKLSHPTAESPCDFRPPRHSADT